MAEWRKVEDFPRYEVSDDGRVRFSKTGRVRKGWTEQSGHQTVTLQNPGEKSKRVKIHRLVAKAYLPNPDKLPFVRHLNDVPGDNRLENLAWGTNSDNQIDSIRNGTHFAVRITHCPQGHEYTVENTSRRGKRQSRFCKVCDKQFHREQRKKGLPPDDPRHGLPSTRGNWGCNCDPCSEADRERSRRQYRERQKRGKL